MRDVREAMVSTVMHLNKIASEFNNYLPGSTYGFTQPFLPTASIYTHNGPFFPHVDEVIAFTILKSELF